MGKGFRRVLFDQAGYELVRGGRVADHPFLHCEFGPDSIVSTSAVSSLLNSFPHGMMQRAASRSEGSDKNYYVAHLNVYDRGAWVTPAAGLAPAWRRLLGYLVGPSYAAAIRSLLDLDDVPMSIEMRLSCYPSGGWMSRHTDRPDKLFSHNIYLCPEWDPAWGGELAMYGSATDSLPARVVVPGAGNSVAFRRSDSSWHEVKAVTTESARPRRAVLVHGYRTDGAGSSRRAVDA
jgi:hypothetical protein